MRPIITFALTAVLAITFASCNKQQELINQEARLFMSSTGDYACDILSDTADIGKLLPSGYFDTESEDLNVECIRCTTEHCLWYFKDNQTASNFADYYNALMMFHALCSDRETAQRFGEDDKSVYASMAESISLINHELIHNDTLSLLIKQLRDEMQSYVHQMPKKSYDKVEHASDKLFAFLTEKVNPVMENTRDEYISYSERIPFTNNFDSIVALRGTSDKAYQQELLTKLYLAETPAERHMYAIEFAHSDSTNAHFLIGAYVLSREFRKGDYSPYLSEMWRTWRASLSTLIGASSWSYIPNSLYNSIRQQIAQSIIKQIEEHPEDILAQGVLIDLAGINNISRYGSYFGNASIVEQMAMFPEWDKNKRIVK